MAMRDASCTLGTTLLMVDPHFLEVKQATSIQASVTAFTPGSGCTNAPGYTLFTKLIQTD